MLMMRFVGTLTLLVVLASPTVPQARLFCRYTGIEVTDCAEQREAERPAVQPEGCCELRLSNAPAPVLQTPEPVLPQALALAPWWAQPLPMQPAPAVRGDRVSRGSAGPPLFVQQHALLI